MIYFWRIAVPLFSVLFQGERTQLRGPWNISNVNCTQCKFFTFVWERERERGRERGGRRCLHKTGSSAPCQPPNWEHLTNTHSWVGMRENKPEALLGHLHLFPVAQLGEEKMDDYEWKSRRQKNHLCKLPGRPASKRCVKVTVKPINVLHLHWDGAFFLLSASNFCHHQYYFKGVFSCPY